MENKKMVSKGLPKFARGEQRYFSEAVRREVVSELDAKKTTIPQVCQDYGISRASVYSWLSKYSPLYVKKIVQVVEHQSESERRKQLENKIGELERIIGRKTVEVEYWRTLVEMAEKESGTDLKKNSDIKSCDSSTNKLNDKRV
jgi:transposase-like protein